MEYKHDKLKSQFEIINPRLRALILEVEYFVNRLYGKELVITSLIRLNKDRVRSVHAYGRGADVRSYIFTEAEKQEILAHINNNFDYGDGIHETCILHDVGIGEHFHLQVSE